MYRTPIIDGYRNAAGAMRAHVSLDNGRTSVNMTRAQLEQLQAEIAEALAADDALDNDCPAVESASHGFTADEIATGEFEPDTQVTVYNGGFGSECGDGMQD